MTGVTSYVLFSSNEKFIDISLPKCNSSLASNYSLWSIMVMFLAYFKFNG